MYFFFLTGIMSIAQEQLQCFDLSQNFYPNVTFTEVELTDFYRKNKPYRLLTNPGRSSVTMTFGLSGADNISKVASGNKCFICDRYHICPDIQWPSDCYLFHISSGKMGTSAPATIDPKLDIVHQVSTAAKKCEVV